MALHVRAYAAAERHGDPGVRARVAARAVQRADRLGAALPLSGEHKAVGETVRRGFEAASALEGITRGGPGAPEVLWEDTGGTPEGAAAAIERLVLGDHVLGIAGPVGDREGRAAAFRAAELEVPLVLMAQGGAATELAARSPWVFRLRFGPEDQAREAAAYAAGVLGLRSFALAWPEDRFGRSAAEAFWRRVEADGGAVRGIGAWSPEAGTEGLDRAARGLVGGREDGAWPAARGDRFGVGEGKFRGYRPIVDFRGLYVPAHPAEAGRLLRHLAYYDVALRSSPGVPGEGRSADTGRDEARIQVIGPASWSDPSAAAAAPRELDNSLVIDVFDPDDPDPAVARFVAAFRRRHGRPPTSLEAQACDTMRWLVAAWRAAGDGETGRDGVRRALLTRPPEEAVTGPLTVDPGGVARSAARAFTLSAGRVRRREALDRP